MTKSKAKIKPKKVAVKAAVKGKQAVNWTKLAISIFACQAAGILGSAFTMPAIPTWYAALSKPWFTPPSFVFGPVWIMLYVMMGIAFYLVWVKGIKGMLPIAALCVFVVQLALNALWSFLFFGLQSPFYGFMGIVPLWLSIILTTVLFYKIDKRAGLLLLPYLAWVTFASLLNYTIWLMNP